MREHYTQNNWNLVAFSFNLILSALCACSDTAHKHNFDSKLLFI